MICLSTVSDIYFNHNDFFSLFESPDIAYSFPHKECFVHDRANSCLADERYIFKKMKSVPNFVVRHIFVEKNFRFLVNNFTSCGTCIDEGQI